MRVTVAVAVLLGAMLFPTSIVAQRVTAHAQKPERPIHRDIPLTNMIRRAMSAGTRDSSGRPGPNYWQLWTEYTIKARLEPSTSQLTGRESIVLHNNSDSALRTIVMRLDQNIYAPNVPRDQQMPEITDGMKITRLSVNGQNAVLKVEPGQCLPSSTHGVGADSTLTTPRATGLGITSACIGLPSPIESKATAHIDVEWSFKVPHVEGERGLRMGTWGDTLYEIAQWYPRVAVFDDLREGGWDTEQYLGTAEFYNNYGHFDVSIDVPAGWIVGATGVLQNAEQVLTSKERERLSHVLESDSMRAIVGPGERGAGVVTAAGDRLVWHFVADTVADFAWGTSNQYVWNATRATIPGRGAVPINMLYLAGDASKYAEVGPTVRHALEFYSKLWMPYAYPTFTVIDGPDTGMEYPQLIMSSQGAADHETGHQWWPMMVGVNETWYGFMDEGFNQSMNILSDQDAKGELRNVDGYGRSYGQTSGDEREAPLMWNENFGGPMYGFEAYDKTPEMLSMLGGVVGDSAVTRAMSEYAKAWRFKHPSPWDYAFFMDRALKKNLGWFWYYWLFTTEEVNGSIASVTTTGARTIVTVRQGGEMPSPVVLQVQLAPRGPPIRMMANGRATDSVTAVVTYPVEVWFTGSRTFKATLDFGGRRITRITLDPFGRFPDNDTTDNVWPRAAALARQNSGGRPVTLANMNDFATRYTAAWCSKDPSQVASFFADNGSLTINGGSPSVGRAAITGSARGFMSAFPDLKVEMNAIEPQGAGFIYRWTLSGTNAGAGGTGNHVRITGYEEWTIGADGLISKSLGHFDEAEYERQLKTKSKS
ncbi:MAG: ester cyclase [Gemmatimonadota bacterium]|nr:ester cyclase [Gemmatimonadota bacterium]